MKKEYNNMGNICKFLLHFTLKFIPGKIKRNTHREHSFFLYSTFLPQTEQNAAD